MLSEHRDNYLPFGTPVVATGCVKTSKTGVTKQELLTERLDGPVLSAASDTPQPGPAGSSGRRLLRMVRRGARGVVADVPRVHSA